MAERFNITTQWPELPIADTDEQNPLPLPFHEYQGEPRNATLVSSGGNNPKVARRARATWGYQRLAVSWIFTPIQYYRFQTFYVETLGNGGAAFRMPLRYPLNSELVEWVVKFFGDGFDSTYLDNRWRVEAEIELLGPYLLNDAAPPEDWGQYLVNDTDDVPYQTSDGYIYHVRT